MHDTPRTSAEAFEQYIPGELLTPSQYFIRLRMEEARRLLSETSDTIIDIGLAVGYSSPSHFSSVFRKHTGIAPSAYR